MRTGVLLEVGALLTAEDRGGNIARRQRAIYNGLKKGREKNTLEIWQE